MFVDHAAGLFYLGEEDRQSFLQDRQYQPGRVEFTWLLNVANLKLQLFPELKENWIQERISTLYTSIYSCHYWKAPQNIAEDFASAGIGLNVELRKPYQRPHELPNMTITA